MDRKRIIYPYRPLDNPYGDYPILNIKNDFPIPPNWIEIFPNTNYEVSTGTSSSNLRFKHKDVNSFKYENEEWVDDIPFIRNTKKQEMATERYNIERSGYDFNGYHVDTDDISQNKINSIVLAAMNDPSYSVQWKMVDGTFVTLNHETIIALGISIRNFIQGNFDKEMNLRNYIDTLNTRDEIESVTWDTIIPTNA